MGQSLKSPRRKDNIMGSSLVDVIRLRVKSTEQVTVVTAGTPVNPTSDTINEAVRVINNNASKVVAVGPTSAGVDATSTPQIGTVLGEGDELIWYASKGGDKDLANEVFIDATVNGTVVTVEHLGV